MWKWSSSMRCETGHGRESKDKERARLALIRRGIADIAHDLYRLKHEGTLLLEDTMSSIEPPLPQELTCAYDELIRTSSVSRRNLETCEDEVLGLLRC